MGKGCVSSRSLFLLVGRLEPGSLEDLLLHCFQQGPHISRTRDVTTLKSLSANKEYFLYRQRK